MRNVAVHWSAKKDRSMSKFRVRDLATRVEAVIHLFIYFFQICECEFVE